MSWSNLGQSSNQPEVSESGPPERLVLDLEAGLEGFLVTSGFLMGCLSVGLVFSFDEFSSSKS